MEGSSDFEKAEVLVSVNNVSKKFCRNLKRSLWYGLGDMVGEIVGRTSDRSLRKDEFWALSNVSFELRRGECMGLIGHNGSGKSTLLKMLNGLIKPDTGRIEMNGRVGALIELGAGFNPVLTGRENVYINGQVLGFTKAEITERYHKIVQFSELHDFMDSPVRSYSSGMKVRLGFAIAAQMEPDILIIDEVLAVGDVGFRGKCLSAISEMVHRSAVIFVSHQMPQVNRFCTRGLLLNGGKTMVDGSTQGAIDKYFDHFSPEKGNKYIKPGNTLVEFLCNGSKLDHDESVSVPFGSMIEFKVEVDLQGTVVRPRVKINFLNRDLMVIATVVSPVELVGDDETLKSVTVKCGPMILTPGDYKISLRISSDEFRDVLIYQEAWWSIYIKGETDYGSNFVVLDSVWKV